MFQNIKDSINHEKRMDWNNYFMSIAHLISSRSACNRLHVGCVLVKDNRVISSGYNGFLPNMPHKSRVRDNHEQATVHAEQNCIADCAKRGISTENATAYITHYPCINCCKILLASGIKEIIYDSEYGNDEIVAELLSETKVVVTKLE
tara:strand:+ start:2912 stop:3355 length:444 start_codon:yes stop_codon:yes gene_type:complete